MKLKTLKDLVSDLNEGFDDVRSIDLKQEAIKWIKEIEKELKKGSQCFTAECVLNKKIIFRINGRKVSMKKYNKGLDLISFTPKTISWIKHFFNITDEDLR